MNKAELIESVAENASLSKSDATGAVDAVFECITKELTKRGTVALIGFGTFATSDRAARTGRNPRTGETIKIAATCVPKFKAGKGLKDAINK